ncbi:hypothetical protein [Streptomyces sp. PSKA30]|uniref:hypothetical protein n=1 Tax=Streptomyces sp. PSKA30 TaxID=2874597 RepID=UPI001CD07D66|nr:hypothetical protein [Streptomyces sp. PSKA30]MBZ9639694.1 hypothetical protein [Streptomyces sp. PSKA30]
MPAAATVASRITTTIQPGGTKDMLDPELVSVATGAAGTIVASMLTGGAMAIRPRIVQLFRRGTQDEQALALNAHDNDARTLAEWVRAAASDPSSVPDLVRAQEQLTQEWAQRLAEYVDRYQEARPDLDSIAEVGATSNTGSQRNSGSGTFVNGTVIGGIHNTYGGASQ